MHDYYSIAWIIVLATIVVVISNSCSVIAAISLARFHPRHNLVQPVLLKMVLLVLTQGRVL